MHLHEMYFQIFQSKIRDHEFEGKTFDIDKNDEDLKVYKNLEDRYEYLNIVIIRQKLIVLFARTQCTSCVQHYRRRCSESKDLL